MIKYQDPNPQTRLVYTVPTSSVLKSFFSFSSAVLPYYYCLYIMSKQHRRFGWQYSSKNLFLWELLTAFSMLDEVTIHEIVLRKLIQPWIYTSPRDWLFFICIQGVATKLQGILLDRHRSLVELQPSVSFKWQNYTYCWKGQFDISKLIRPQIYGSF